MSKKSSLVFFILSIVLVIISIRAASPGAVTLGSVPDSAFSVNRAYTHLLQISRLPHSTGTAQNERVREYIIEACRKSGFEVEIQNSLPVIRKGERLITANIYNIIARKKGRQNSKALMAMAHYDSEFNTPGAGDDGAGVAAMLETARALQTANTLQNDLILLFTDAEEIGLLGAHAFVKENPLLKEIGVVINFEGRGNKGPSNMFEVNSGNGWIINEYANSVAHPFGNSLGYEIYKKLPNGTDFTLFKNSGISGLNNAYIEGFVNYHSPNDKPENMDLRSLQNQGENMLSLVKHFGNLKIAGTKAPDASYFNVIGNWFVHYPASWNLIFVVLTNLLFVFFLVSGIKRKHITIGGSIIAALLFPVVLTIIYFSAKYLLRFILFCYPMYSHFDENNSYNSSWYFLAMGALAFTIFIFIYYFIAKRVHFNSLLAGNLLIVILLMNVMQYAMPTASYLLFIPLLSILVVRLIVMGKYPVEELQSIRFIFFNFISVVPAIFFLAPTLYFTFVAFGLGDSMPFVTIAVGIGIGLFLPVLYATFKNQKLLIPFIGMICFIGSILGGHLTSGYSEKNPLQVSLRYRLDTDSSKASWISDFTATDKWSSAFFKGENINPNSSKKSGWLMSAAPVLPLMPPEAVIIKDTLENQIRKLIIHFNSSRENVTSINIALKDKCRINAVSVKGKVAKAEEDDKAAIYRNISYTGLTSNGFDVFFEIDEGKKLDMIVSDRSIGLPQIPGFNTGFPGDIIPAPGANSNTTQVGKRFVL